MSSVAPTPPRERQLALDALRGIVMVLMVLDHARDLYADGFLIRPTDMHTSTPVLFFTRWITHFCAPVFVFTAGVSARMYAEQKGARAASRFLFTRGVWLVLLELTVVRLGWTPDPLYRITILQVIWALGLCMVCVSPLTRLPSVVLASLGALIVVGHDAFDAVSAASLSHGAWLWKIAHDGGVLQPWAGHRFVVSYPFVPWLGIMLLGYASGAVLRTPTPRIVRAVTLVGVAVTAAFVVLRAHNGYGDPGPWSTQSRGAMTVASFLNCEKYPPSLAYTLMTLGPALVVWALLARRDRPWMRPLAVIGSVPLMFYVAHLLLLRWTAAPIAYLRFGMRGILPPPAGHAGSPAFPLWGAYLVWAVAVALLYPVCQRFRALKRQHTEWWWRYL